MLMRHIIACAIGLVSIAACWSCSTSTHYANAITIESNVPSNNSHARLINRLSGATVVILDKLEPNRKRHIPLCGGVWINDHGFVTAHHCVISASMTVAEYERYGRLAKIGAFDMTDRKLEYAVIDDYASIANVQSNATDMTLNASRVRAGKIAAVAFGADLVYIDTCDAAMTTVNVKKSDTTQGETVHSISHPTGLIYTYLVGTVSHPRRMIILLDTSSRTAILQASIGIYLGSSGSGLFDADGRLVGILTEIRGAPTTALYVHGSEIAKLVEKRIRSTKKNTACSTVTRP